MTLFICNIDVPDAVSHRANHESRYTQAAFVTIPSHFRAFRFGLSFALKLQCHLGCRFVLLVIIKEHNFAVCFDRSGVGRNGHADRQLNSLVVFGTLRRQLNTVDLHLHV